MSKLLVVVGATGSQGLAVVKFFQQNEPSVKLRGLTRNPSSDAARALADQGVEIVRADLGDIESLKTAFQGATYIFAYTDYGGIARSPETMAQLKSDEITSPPGAIAAATEAQQGKNVADAAITVTQLERLVWSALSDVKKWSKGKLTQVFNFNGKAEATEYMLSIKGLEGKVSTVQMGWFASNAARWPAAFGFKKEDDGLHLEVHLDQDVKMPWIDVERDTGSLVRALIQAPAPAHLVGQSESLTLRQWIKMWTAHTGVGLQYHNILSEGSMKDDAAALKPERIQGMQYILEFGFSGGDPDVLMPDQFEKKFGIAVPRHTIENYIKNADWTPLLQL